MTTETDKIPSLDDITSAPLKTTGNEIPTGSYGSTLFGFGAPFRVKTAEKFRKPGQPETRVVFDARFGTFDKDGQLVELTYLLPVPDGGAANRKSNVYKMLKALAGSDTKLIAENGNLVEGVTLKSFYGKTGVLAVEQNTEGWPQVKGVTARMEGIKYPTVEECQANLKGSDGVPF